MCHPWLGGLDQNRPSHTSALLALPTGAHCHHAGPTLSATITTERTRLPSGHPPPALGCQDSQPELCVTLASALVLLW